MRFDADSGEHTVTSPLAEERYDTVASKTVDRSTVAEESAVVPPGLVGTLHLEEAVVLVDLELDPLALGVSLAVEASESSLGLGLTSASEQPTRGLGKQQSADCDETREHDLEADGDHPGGVAALVVQTTTGGTTGNHGTNGPHDVVETGDETTVSGVGHLNNVNGTGSGGDTDTEAKEETTSH